MKKFIWILVALLVAAPLASWAFYKPVRVLAPSWVGNVSCVSQHICLEDEGRVAEAMGLYENALRATADAVGPFLKSPRVTFCSTAHCFQSFGFSQAAAAAVGRSGIVIGPRGWEDHYLRHEMIHYRQAEELGMLAPLVHPEWLIEGMAYALSGDPRDSLTEPWESYRRQFDDWYRENGGDRLWREAAKL